MMVLLTLLKQLELGASNTLAKLTQIQTNGKSVWGTLLAPVLQTFLTTNPLPFGKPWGLLTDFGNNPYTSAPNTGVVRTYDWTISRGIIAPDGYQRDVLLVNGQFPGPLIESNWGDKIVVTIHNNITGPEEGTSFHWHGFLQQGTNWEDGVPGITQCPIAPGQTYTYEFDASLYGSTWYHSHYSAQYSGGLTGPMVIHGPSEAVYDLDLGPVMLSDWYHASYFDLVEETLKPGARPVSSDNNLINGKMTFDCSTVTAGDTTKCTNDAGYSEFRFTRGKTHRLRLINTGAEAVQRFSIDGHTMTVIANDFLPIKPYNTKVVTLGVGQRADVLVKANAHGLSKSFWMRSDITSCSFAKQPHARAIVYYNDAIIKNMPASTPWNVPDPGDCTNDALSLTEPLYPIALPKPDITNTMDIELFVNGSGVNLWKFGGVSFRTNYNDPNILSANRGDLNFEPEANVIIYQGTPSIRLIVNNKSPAAHPMHLHGHNFYVLHEGPGEWDGTIVRPKNPQRRDVQQLRAQGHLVIQFDSTPGVWVWHCHIAWHASAGFFSTLIIDPSQVQKDTIPEKVQQTCREWDDWTSRNVVDQIDSGN